MLHDLRTDSSDPEMMVGGGASDPISQLLETRQAARDFQVPGGTIRVETRIKLNRSPWTVRSIVLENGVEVQEGPFGPIQEDLDPFQTESEDRDELRLAFARQALVGHEARCRQIEKALKGTPVSGKGAGKAVAVAAFLVVLLALIGAAAYFLGPGKRSASQTAGPLPSPSSAGPVTSGVAPVPQAFEAEAGAARESEPEPAPTPFRVTVPAPHPAPSQGQKAPRTGNVPRASTPGKPAPPPPATGTRSRATEQAAVTAPRKPERETDLLHVVEPSIYSVGSLQAGEDAFVDEPATFSEVPAVFRDARCIRTANADRAQKILVSFRVGREGRLYVGHDRRIRKKPDWLQSFSKTGQQWTVRDAEQGEVTFDVFAREVAAGPVVLGANTEWTGFTQRLREKFPKNIKMYIVCIQAS